MQCGYGRCVDDPSKCDAKRVAAAVKRKPQWLRRPMKFSVRVRDKTKRDVSLLDSDGTAMASIVVPASEVDKSGLPDQGYGWYSKKLNFSDWVHVNQNQR